MTKITENFHQNAPLWCFGITQVTLYFLCQWNYKVQLAKAHIFVKRWVSNEFFSTFSDHNLFFSEMNFPYIEPWFKNWKSRILKFPGKFPGKLKFPGKFPFPGKPKIREN